MRIGVIADGYVDANGTLDYLKIILRGLYVRPDAEIFMFFSSDNERKLRHIPSLYRKLFELIVPYKRNSSIDSFSEFKDLHIIEYQSLNLNKKIQECQLDVIFPSMIDLGKNIPVKWAIEFFDCQHKYYPQYFPKRTRIGRNLFMQAGLTHADVVFVNSQKAKNDFSKFFNIDNDKIRVLPLCATHDYHLVGDDNPEITEIYNLRKPYFLISNQFYVHKRHDVAFRALKLLRNKGYDVSIVCTGFMDETSGLMKDLKELIVELGLPDYVRLLGVIPKKDQIEIMKQSISVIQPSEFEGDCSGQIIDAITIGQRSIASDIEVIKEISYLDTISFFKLDDYIDLAAKMEAYLNTPYKRPTIDVLLKQEENYIENFSNAMYKIITDMTK